jgi:hypothetical protein
MSGPRDVGSQLAFQAWPKLPRLHKDIIVTEKIDGTNAAVSIVPIPEGVQIDPAAPETGRQLVGEDLSGVPGGYNAKFFTRNGDFFLLAAQSRKRLITPESDNFGFARWAFDHAQDLLVALGAGRHYGEWWGSGIQRGYGLPKGEKRFSLFNRTRYPHLWDPDQTREELFDADGNELLPELDVVPVLYEGPFSEQAIEDAMQSLDDTGSFAAPGFKPAEGVVIFHEAAQQLFKWPFDPEPKGTPYTPPEPLTKSNGAWTN